MYVFSKNISIVFDAHSKTVSGKTFLANGRSGRRTGSKIAKSKHPFFDVLCGWAPAPSASVAHPQAYYILEEVLLCGELQETSKKAILRVISCQEALLDTTPGATLGAVE